VLTPSVAFALGLSVGIVGAALAGRLVFLRLLEKARAAERRARSAERLAEIGSMTGGLAHEIKNPLSTISLNAQLLSEGLEELHGVETDDRGRLVKRLGSLRREVERLKGILTDFLAYAGELRLDLKTVDLGASIEELADFFSPQAAQMGVKLRTQIAPLPKMTVDAPHLKQALLNLMLNAAQAMSLQASDKPRELVITLKSHLEADKRRVAVIEVIDSGPGIDAAAQERLFSPYFTTKSGGTGLGLPTTRRIVEAHGGVISVESKPGEGACFRIVLPI
jgi:signal transduction histidine kinase